MRWWRRRQKRSAELTFEPVTKSEKGAHTGDMWWATPLVIAEGEPRPEKVTIMGQEALIAEAVDAHYDRKLNRIHCTYPARPDTTGLVVWIPIWPKDFHETYK